MFSAQGDDAQAELYFYVKMCKISDLQTIQIFRIIKHWPLVQNEKQYVLYNINEKKAETVKMMVEVDEYVKLEQGCQHQEMMKKKAVKYII
jgi:hypothetical protein